MTLDSMYQVQQFALFLNALLTAYNTYNYDVYVRNRLTQNDNNSNADGVAAGDDEVDEKLLLREANQLMRLFNLGIQVDHILYPLL